MSIVVGSNTLGSYPTTLTNLAAFYKYEPFSFSFTGGSNFTASGSLVAFCSGVGTSNLVFSATNGFQSVGSSSGDTLTVGCTISAKAVSNNYILYLNAGRFVISPTTTALTLYYGEAASVAFTSQSNLTTVYTSPSLPAGVVFGTLYSPPTSNWVLSTGAQGPALLAANSNYTFFGSNTTTGNSVFSTLSVQVVGERLTMTPTTDSNTLVIGTPMTSAIFSNDHYSQFAVSNGVVFGKPSLPAGLAYSTTAGPLVVGGSAYPLGTGIYVSGTPVVSTNIPSSTVSVTITTTAVGTSARTASSVLTFNYSPTVLFTSPALPSPTNTTYTTYVGVPLLTTLTSNVALVAAVRFASVADPIVAYAATNLPPGLTLTTVGTPPAAVSAYISGTPTTICSSNVVLTATSSTGLVGSNTITVSCSQVVLTITPSTTSTQVFTVARSLANPNGSYTYPLTFTLSTPAYPSTSTNWISSSSINKSSGFTYSIAAGTSNYVATLLGTPQTSAATSGSTITLSAQTIDGAQSSAGINYSVSNDTFAFTTTSAVPFIFGQNQTISPVQFFVSTASGTPVTYFTPSTLTPLPSGLTMISTGQLQGAPLTPSSGWIIFNAANGYATGSPTATQFPYVVIADTMLITSTAARIPLSYTANSIPLTVRLSSGVVPNTLVASNYMYGLSLATPYTPFVLTGATNTGVAIPAFTRLTFAGYATGVSSVSATVDLEIVGGNIPTINRYTIRSTNLGYGVYKSSNLFAYSKLYSGSTSVLFDFQLGGGTYLTADGTTSIRDISGTPVLTTGGISLVQLAFMSNTWYALGGSASGLYVYYSNANPWSSSRFNFFQPSPTLYPRSTDGGYVMRATTTNLLIGGSNGIIAALIGSSSSSTTNCTLINVNEISTTGSVVVAAGSNGLQYSTNGGSIWNNVINSGLAIGRSVVYGQSVSPIWMAYGSAASGSNAVSVSTDGITWSNVLSFPATTTIGPLQFDGTTWSLFVNSNASPVLSATSDNSYVVYQHDVLTTTMTDSASWDVSNATFAATDSPSTTALYTFPVPTIVANGTPTLTLLVGATTSGGPTFVLPTVTTYKLYQYLPTSIVFDAGVGATYFVDTSTLPPGMTWTTNIPTGYANKYTALISGSSVKLGLFNIDVYGELSTGNTKITITISVSRLFPTTDHKTAAAYTAFTREKVIADAATSSVDNHVLPTAVGPFLLDKPPYETTVPAICCDPTVKNIK